MTRSLRGGADRRSGRLEDPGDLGVRPERPEDPGDPRVRPDRFEDLGSLRRNAWFMPISALFSYRHRMLDLLLLLRTVE